MTRYDRQIILPGVGADGQAKLRASRVLVIGAGGLGSPVCLYLAAAGVGTIGIADHDTVDETNLHRQVLHSTDSLNEPKTESARQRLKALNPEVEIELYNEGVTPENAVALFSKFDLIVDGSDNFPTRFLNNDAAFFAAKPLVYGSIFQFEGQVSLFHPSSKGPCYRCLFPEMPDPGSVPNCAEAGVFGSLCGIIGSWQANEAIKFILGIGEPLIGRIKIINTLSCREQTVSLKKDLECPLCGNAPSIRSIEPKNYQYNCNMPDSTDNLPLEVSNTNALETLKNDPEAMLFDVREPEEHAVANLGEGLFIPLNLIPESLDKIPRQKPLLVYCHHGMRSLRATQFLRENGFSLAQSIRGGIDAWSKQIDPSVPRY